MSTSKKALTSQELDQMVVSEDFWRDMEDTEEVAGSSAVMEVFADNEGDALKQILENADMSDSEEEDQEEISDHDTVSDIEWVPNEDDIEDEEGNIEDTEKEAIPSVSSEVNSVESSKNAWYGQGKAKFKWAKDAPSRTKTLSHNIVTVLPGLKGPSRQNSPTSPLEAWSLLITDEMVDIIVLHTNSRIEQLQSRYKKFKSHKNSRQKFAPTFIKKTEPLEIRAFIGLLYMQGLFKSNHEDLKSLWATDGTGRDLFRCTMSLARFSFLLSCLRFDDANTRVERIKENKLAAISEIFNKFVCNSKENYSPGVNVTVDEMLVPFRGRCGFRMYIPNKPAKYGLKVQILSDSKTHYMTNAEVYTGKTTNSIRTKNPGKKLSHPTEVVLRLTRPIINSNRNVTADNWYSSIELIDELRQVGLTYVGTLKKNKAEIPPQFMPNRNRNVGSSLFGFTANKTIVSYVPKSSKAVVLISSMHHSNSVDKDSGKPEIILYYNSTKSGVDSLDEKCANYSTSRRTRRWPMALFHAVLNIAGVNSRVIYQFAKGGEEISRYNFIKELGRQLYSPYIASRISMNYIPRKLRMLCADIIGVAMESQPVPAYNLPKSKRRRCAICPSAKDRKTNNYCFKCQIPLCLQCATTVCPDCK